jgi:hypothetical protein
MALDVDTSAAPSDAGHAHPRPWLRAMGRAAVVAADTGDVSVSGLAGITAQLHAKGASAHARGAPTTPGRPDARDGASTAPGPSGGRYRRPIDESPDILSRRLYPSEFTKGLYTSTM